MNSSERSDDYEYILRGKDWDIYWLLLKSGRPMSVREVQRSLRFSSPSVAHHHLEQLRAFRLVKKQDVGGCYCLTSEIKIGVLRHFIKLGKLLFPRYLFYAFFSTASFVVSLFMFLQLSTRETFFFLLFGAVITLILWYETYRVWNLKPF